MNIAVSRLASSTVWFDSLLESMFFAKVEMMQGASPNVQCRAPRFVWDTHSIRYVIYVSIFDE